MKQKLPSIARYLLGLIFFVFGGAGLLNLIPPPSGMPEKLMTFMSGLMAAEYFFPLLKGTEAICGLLLLLGIAPALALVVLAPISLNIFLVHLFLTPGLENLIIPTAIVTLHLYVATNYWQLYRPLFLAKEV
jgi:putative oxidoreductase